MNLDDWAPRPVGRKQPNRLGFHDMQGNVWEWCSSRYQPYPYDPRAGQEPLSSATERASATDATRDDGGSLRVLRGGGFADSAALQHPAFRYAYRPHHAFRWVGFRLARSIPPVK
jgi:formylglycine-generating enzyme required for sulfatase activity